MVRQFTVDPVVDDTSPPAPNGPRVLLVSSSIQGPGSKSQTPKTLSLPNPGMPPAASPSVQISLGSAGHRSSIFNLAGDLGLDIYVLRGWNGWCGAICQKSPDVSHLAPFAVCTCFKSKQKPCLEVSRGGYRNFWWPGLLHSVQLNNKYVCMVTPNFLSGFDSLNSETGAYRNTVEPQMIYLRLAYGPQLSWDYDIYQLTEM